MHADTLIDAELLIDDWMQRKAQDRRRSVLWFAATMAALLLLGTGFLRAPQDPAPRAGGVTSGGALVVWSPGYRVSFYGVEHLHPFDTQRNDRIAETLIAQGVLKAEQIAIPAPVSDAQLRAVHADAWLDSVDRPQVLSEALEIWLPNFIPPGALRRRVLTPFRRAVGGTLVATRGAMEHGLGVNLGGGFHHAGPDQGGGFCVYNDVAVAIDTLRSEGWEGRVLIVDTDAHQGDGNHAFFKDDPDVISFSMHQRDIFPVPKVPGDLDVGLAAGTGDAAFLAQLEENLVWLMERERPDLVFHVAGADVLATDPLAGLALSIDGLVARDALVAQEARSRQVPLVHLLAGGYGPDAATAQARSVARLVR